MGMIKFDLEDKLADRLRVEAVRRGLTLEEYMVEIIETTLSQRRTFEESAKHVLEKNAELYRRLAAN